jgi:hypothetical protein
MTDIREANKERNRQIAHNEEARQITGNIRVSTWAVFVAVMIGAVLFTLVWVAMR